MGRLGVRGLPPRGLSGLNRVSPGGGYTGWAGQTDDYTDLSKWDTPYEPGTSDVSAVSNELVFTIPSGEAVYPDIFHLAGGVSPNVLSLQGEHLMHKMTQKTSDATRASLEWYFVMRLDGDANNALGMQGTGGTWARPYYIVGGSQTNGSSWAYDYTAEPYVRIRESGGTTYWESSTNATSWTERWSVSNPIAVTALETYLAVGCWDTEAAEATIKFGGLNIT